MGLNPLQGRSTVKGQMGHVSTSFCVSKDNFDQFWEQNLKESKELGIEDPKLKRKEKIPKKIANFIYQDEPENFAYTVEEHYEAIFLKSFDLHCVANIYAVLPF